MTKSEWQICTDPRPMLQFLARSGGESDRKLRLLVCACVRLNLLLVPISSIFAQLVQEAIEKAEEFADGTLLAPFSSAPHPYSILGEFDLFNKDVAGAMEAMQRMATDAASGDAVVGQAVQRRQAGYLRDIFGNPSPHPVKLDPAWLEWNNGTVVALSQQIYDDEDFGALPILADALQDSSCRESEILDHCRSGGEHVRGCWVVDGLLNWE